MMEYRNLVGSLRPAPPLLLLPAASLKLPVRGQGSWTLYASPGMGGIVGESQELNLLLEVGFVLVLGSFLLWVLDVRGEVKF